MMVCIELDCDEVKLFYLGGQREELDIHIVVAAAAESCLIF